MTENDNQALITRLRAIAPHSPVAGAMLLEAADALEQMAGIPARASPTRVYVCRDRDIECGSNSNNWCAVCPLSGSTTSPAPDLVKAAQAVVDGGRQIHGLVYDVSSSRMEALRAALAALPQEKSEPSPAVAIDQNESLGAERTLNYDPDDWPGEMIVFNPVIPTCQQSKTSAFLEQELIADTTPWRHLPTDEFKRLYLALNNMLSEIGHEGKIDSRHKFTREVVESLRAIDGGVYVEWAVCPPVAGVPSLVLTDEQIDAIAADTPQRYRRRHWNLAFARAVLAAAEAITGVSKNFHALEAAALQGDA